MVNDNESKNKSKGLRPGRTGPGSPSGCGPGRDQLIRCCVLAQYMLCIYCSLVVVSIIRCGYLSLFARSTDHPRISDLTGRRSRSWRRNDNNNDNTNI